ncbi:MAG TPA: AarF/UbiB family protein [Candidatus Competibacteraceae bacterium]|nr:AarF/UbiB family protein [Candidatus Competibacteraceae bacterium]
MLETLGFALRGALRLGGAARVLAGTGLEWLRGERAPAPQLLRRACERLGPTYVKLGQFIASSPSLFPAEYVEAFEGCLDRTEPLPFRVMERVLVQELGRDLGRHFAAIDPEPLASASIAQVHAAELRGGGQVVLKIQKPGVRETLTTDMQFLYVTTRLLEWLAPQLSAASLSAIVQEIQRTMMEECDFLQEAEHIRQFREFLARSGNSAVTAPCLYPHHSTLRVLTLERLYGVPLTDLEAIRRHVPDPRQALVTALNTWFQSLIECETFHADVHAGNLLALEDGRLAFIDFGIVGRIAPATWGALSALLSALSADDPAGMARAMAALGATREDVDVNALARDIEALYADLERLNAASGSVEHELNHLLLQLMELGRRHGIRLPRAFALLLKQFLYFDRYIRLLAPELKLFDRDWLPGEVVREG